MSSAVIDAPPGPAADRNRLHLVFSIDTMGVGGTEMNAIRTAERLDRGRYRLSVVTLRGEGPLAARYERMGVPVLRFPIRNLYGPETVRQGIRLARFLRAERVSVVHCHDQYSNFFSTLKPISRLSPKAREISARSGNSSIEALPAPSKLTGILN